MSRAKGIDKRHIPPRVDLSEGKASHRLGLMGLPTDAKERAR